MPYSMPLWTILTEVATAPVQGRSAGSRAARWLPVPSAAGRLRPGVGSALPLAGRERLEDRVQVLGRPCCLAADHQAEAALEAKDAAARAAVDIVDADRLELLRPDDVVTVIRVAAIDDDVAFGQQRLEPVQRRLDDARPTP